jgi:hypothetical protein
MISKPVLIDCMILPHIPDKKEAQEISVRRNTNMNTVWLCPFCNTQLQKDARYCGQCGRLLSMSAPARTVPSLSKPTPAHIVSSLSKSIPMRHRFTLLLSVLLLLMIVISILEWPDILPHISLNATPSPTPSTVVPQNCGGAFSDGFHGSLNPRWDPVNLSGSGSATYSTTQGSLRLFAPPNSDINPRYHNFRAPRLLQHISGDFTLSTLISSFSPNTNYQGTGILLWQNQTTFLKVEIAFGLSGVRGVDLEQDDYEGFNFCNKAITTWIAELPADNSKRAVVNKLQQLRGTNVPYKCRKLRGVVKRAGPCFIYR